MNDVIAAHVHPKTTEKIIVRDGKNIVQAAGLPKPPLRQARPHGKPCPQPGPRQRPGALTTTP
ncbi:MAG: hypothetical protein LBP76_09410 [Treponema sp.]|nr:hypothetical protein [Treponema sp.]